MRSHIFVPIPSIEETTGPNRMKFCMEPPEGITQGITEGFLDIRPGGLDVGYPWAPGGGQKFWKKFSPIFLLFLLEIVFIRSNSLVKWKLIFRWAILNDYGARLVARVHIPDNLCLIKHPKHSNWPYEGSIITIVRELDLIKTISNKKSKQFAKKNFLKFWPPPGTPGVPHI